MGEEAVGGFFAWSYPMSGEDWPPCLPTGPSPRTSGMKLSEAQRARVRRLLGSNSTSFVELARAAELDPGTAFREADLRRINFGLDDLAGFDFTGADLRGANLSQVRGLDPAFLEGARTDDATRGFIIRDFPVGPEMVLIPPEPS